MAYLLMISGLLRKNMNKRFLPLRFKHIARAVVPGILFTISSCNNDPGEIKALTAKNVYHEDIAKDVTTIYSEKGKIRVRVFTKELIRNDAATPSYIEMRNGLKVEFYNDSGHVESTLTARHAWFYEKQQNALVRDSVDVINKKGEQLKTQELVWNQAAQKFFTEKPVRIITPTQVLFGDGMEANQDFTWYQIKNFKGSVQVDNTEVPQ